MFTRQIITTMAAITIACGSTFGQVEAKKPADAQPESPDASAKAKDPAYVLKYKMKPIDSDKAVDLSKYEGKVVVIVNVASRCGLTPHYEGLQALYEEKKDDGLVVLGFPANNFGGQEPGTNEEIKAFCTDRFDVTFPMFQKISVKGDDQHPLYKQLKQQPKPIGGDPEWNFTKFVVDRQGRVVAHFHPRTSPDDPKFVEAIDELLGTEAKEDGKTVGR